MLIEWILLGVALAIVLICAFKGFLKIVMQSFAWVFAWLVMKLFGDFLIGLILEKIGLDAGWIVALVQILLFLVLWLAFRLLSGILAKLMKKLPLISGGLDPVLGAVLGLLIAAALLAGIGYLLRMFGDFLPNAGFLQDFLSEVDHSVILRFFL